MHNPAPISSSNIWGFGSPSVSFAPNPTRLFRQSIPLLAAIAALSAGCDATPNNPGNGGSGGGDVGGAGGNTHSSSSSSSHSNSSSSSSSGAGGGGTGGIGGGGSGGSGGSMGGAGGASMQPICGNAIVEAGEACDDGNAIAGDYCAADCSSITGSCGDAMVQSNETCDDGTITMGCDVTQNGGDGKCVAAGTCSPGHFNVPGTGCVPQLKTDHVHIMVSNTCAMSVMPMEYTVYAGQKLKLSYHNHSQDYPVDVWMMYGGGYTDLAPGGTWNETYEHCFGPSPSEGYADISTACSMFRLKIHCL